MKFETNGSLRRQVEFPDRVNIRSTRCATGNGGTVQAYKVTDFEVRKRIVDDRGKSKKRLKVQISRGVRKFFERCLIFKLINDLYLQIVKILEFYIYIYIYIIFAL